jgi:hypothetical protein
VNIRAAVTTLCLTIVAIPGLAHTQKPPAHQSASAPMGHPYFQQVVPQPTANNGYEEFVQAGDLVMFNGEIEAANAAGASLALKRRVLSMPSSVQALELIRRGLEKPVTSPRNSVDENTTFPELAYFRRLGRLIAVQIYVNFADGHVDAAIDSLRLGLAFGYRIQIETLINGLVGVAIDSLVVKAFAPHLDQLSVYQCGHLLEVMKEFLAADSPAVVLLAKEKAFVLNMLESRRKDPASIGSLLDLMVSRDDEPEDPGLTVLKNTLMTDPGTVGPTIDAAKSKVSALYDQAIHNMQLPLDQQKPVVIDSTNEPAATLSRLLTADPQKIINTYASENARYRLLAIHALIHKYRWDYAALPASLDLLKAKDLVVDTISGRKIHYELTQDRYELTSEDGSAAKAGSIKL